MRQSWDEYFLSLAHLAASRSTCNRLSVGAVLVRDKNVIATGYNGSMHGAPHCSAGECIIHDGHCIATIHAEVNAILQAAKNGVSTRYSTMYITHSPCKDCYKIIYQAGIKRIVYSEVYRSADYSVFGLSDNQSPELVHIPIKK